MKGSELQALGRTRFSAVAEASDVFFDREADRISTACRDMARRFHRGGRLLAVGEGAAGRSDARHVAVEFVHPVLVGKRALPALALEAPQSGPRRLATLSEPDDMLLAMSARGAGRLDAWTEKARERGLLTLATLGRESLEVDHLFVVAHDDPTVVQEVHETLYHVLWELVHVFFENEKVLA